MKQRYVDSGIEKNITFFRTSNKFDLLKSIKSWGQAFLKVNRRVQSHKVKSRGKI